MTPFCTLHAVQHRIGDRTILKIDDLTLEKHDRLLLLGPSGSGKTTLLHVLAGLVHAEGSFVFQGKTIGALSTVSRDGLRGQNIGVVFQKNHLVGHISVLGNVMLAPMAARMDIGKDSALSLLERLGIAHLAKQRACNISHGEAQRVAIARALITRPSLILADEPTSALDDKNAVNVAELLCSLSDGAALVVATHDARIKPYFTRVLTLAEGRIEA